MITNNWLYSGKLTWDLLQEQGHWIECFLSIYWQGLILLYRLWGWKVSACCGIFTSGTRKIPPTMMKSHWTVGKSSTVLYVEDELNVTRLVTMARLRNIVRSPKGRVLWKALSHGGHLTVKSAWEVKWVTVFFYVYLIIKLAVYIHNFITGKSCVITVPVVTKNAPETWLTDFNLVVSMSPPAISCLNSWCYALNPNPLFCFFSWMPHVLFIHPRIQSITMAWRWVNGN